jgi:hypothetical protein
MMKKRLNDESIFYSSLAKINDNKDIYHTSFSLSCSSFNSSSSSSQSSSSSSLLSSSSFFFPHWYYFDSSENALCAFLSLLDFSSNDEV